MNTRPLCAHRRVPRLAVALRAVLVPLAALLVPIACASTSVDELKIEFYNLAGAYYELGDYERAAEYYNRALAIDPQLLDASYNLARTHIETERYQEAEEVLAELLARDPDNLRFQETRAYNYYQRGEVYRALQLYYALLEQSPFRLSALYNIALIHQERGETQLALRFIQRAGDLDEADQEIIYRYAGLLFESNETAITAYYSNLGDYYAIADSLDESYNRALDLYRTVAQDSETEDERLLEIATLFAAERFYADAITVYDRLIGGDPRNATARFRRAVLLLTELDEPLEGVAELERALRNGFENSAEIERLLAFENLLQRIQIEQLLAQYDIEVGIAAGIAPDGDAAVALEIDEADEADEAAQLDETIPPDEAAPDSPPTELIPGLPLP